MSKSIQKYNGDYLNKNDVEQMRLAFQTIVYTTKTENRKRVARRNKLFFEIGISVGVQVSDLLMIKWCDILDNEIGAKEYIILDNTSYGVNETLKKEIQNYVSLYAPKELSDCVFAGNKNVPMTNMMMLNVLKKAADVAGVHKNLTIQSLRKTWAARYIESQDYAEAALVYVKNAFNHLYVEKTIQYIYGECVPKEINKIIWRTRDRRAFELCFDNNTGEKIPLIIDIKA